MKKIYPLKKTKTKTKILMTLLTIISLLTNPINSSSNIIPDPQNPIQIVNQSIIEDLQIIFQFKFNKDSSGLIFRNFLGIKFPLKSIVDLNYLENSTPKYKCLLSDDTTTYDVIPSKSNTEATIAFCLYNDKINTIIKNSEKTFKLTLTFLSNIKLIQDKEKSVNLFITSSTDVNRIIFDQAIFMGNAAIYNDYKNQASNPFDILSHNFFIGNLQQQKLFPNQIFDLEINISSDNFISSSDILFSFKFNSEYLTPANSVISKEDITQSKEKQNPLLNALAGKLTINQNFSLGQISLEGIEEEFTPGRKFRILLKNFQVKEKISTNSLPLEMLVYYKNTYSVISYKKINETFKIDPINFPIFKAVHPNNFDIFRSGVYPMKFSFMINKDILSGSFVLIRHTNSFNLKNRFNFVASTCDFSDNENNFDKNFGKRPTCFPLRTDFNYPDSTNKMFEGSGFFFYMDEILSNRQYTITIWGSADACGGSSVNDFSYLNPDNTNNNFVKFKFKAKVYSRVSDDKISEGRFLQENLVGNSEEIEMENKCWNSQMQLINSFDNTTPKDNAYAILPFEKTIFKKMINADSTKNCSDKNNICKTLKDVNLYKEFTNFSLLQSTELVQNLYLNDMTDDAKFLEYFIYGNTVVRGSSYFALKVNVPILEGTSFYEYIPSPISTYNTNDLKFLPGRLSLNMQNNWFKSGEDSTKGAGCYFSWGTDAKNNLDQVLGNVVLNNIEENTCINGSKIFENRYIISKIPFSNAQCESIKIEEEIDVINSSIPGAENFSNSNSIKILSSFHRGNLGHEYISEKTKADTKSYFAFPLPTDKLKEVIKNPSVDKAHIAFGLFSNCIKWDTQKKIKSLYTSLDLQLNFHYAEDPKNLNGPPIRAIRLIKLFPEGGVFQDTNSSGGKFADVAAFPDITKEGGLQKPYKLHFATGNSYKENGICLIEIYTTGLVSTIGTSNSNVLSIWISFGTLLETDYSDLNSNYPVAPLISESYNSYGFSSGYFFNGNENFYNLNILGDDTNFYYEKSDPKKLYKNQLRLLLHQNSLSTPEYGTNEINYGKDTAYNQKNSSFNLSSNYLNFMGSNVLITNLLGDKITSINSGTNAPNNLLIPFYCPIQNETIKFMNGLPSLYMAFLNMQNFNDISDVNKIFAYKFQEKGDNKFTVVTAVSENLKYYRKMANIENSNAFTVADNIFKNYLFTLRWAPYNSQIFDSEKYLYLFYGTIDPAFTAKANLNCTGHIFLINSDLINLDIAVSKSASISLGEPSVFFNNKYQSNNNNTNPKFYYLGNRFNKAVLLGLGNFDVPLITSSNGSFSFASFSNDRNDFFFKGINRPLINTLYNNGVLKNTFSSIAYFCSTSYREGYQSYTNYLQLKDDKNIEYTFFITDFTPANLLQNEFTVQITKDISEEIFNKDNGANARILLKTPAEISQGWEINFAFAQPNFTTSTICGLKNESATSNTEIISECTNDKGTSIICKAPRTDKNFEICCYNLKLDTDIIKISTLNVSLPNYVNTNTNLNSNVFYNTQKIYDAQNFLNLPFFSWDTNSKGNPLMQNLPFAKIESIKYLHVQQNSGIGKVEIKINLPRDIVRNSSIKIFSKSLAGFVLPNVKINCMVTFSYEFDKFYQNSPDVLLDFCDVSDLSSENKGILIQTKNLIYKCGINFSAKKVSVILFPIKIIDFNEQIYKANKFQIFIRNENGDLANSQEFEINNTIANQVLKNKPLVIDQWDLLCQVKTISPNFPGEISDYEFIFDLEKHKTLLEKAKTDKKEINEISLFFPIDLYGNFIDEVICFNELNEMINCGFAEKGILNIRFLSPLEIKKISVKVYGLVNPYYEKDIIIPCSVNYSNFSTDERENLLTGSAVIKNGFISSGVKIGALRFVNFDILKKSPKEPREFSTHIFNIAFDTANSYTTLPLTLTGNPILIINFPNDYEISYRNPGNISAKINEYKNSGIKVEIKNSYNPTVSISGNKITMTLLNLNSLIFDNAFRYWEVSISNIPAPKKETNLDQIYSTTGSFKILLTTNTYKEIYRTYSTLDNFSNILLKNKFNEFIKFNRGLNFKYNEIKWVININNNNNLSIKTGRFFESNFEIYSQGEKTNPPGIANIELSDKIFKTAHSKYFINSNLKENLKFFIGAPCGKAPGIYLVNFTLTNLSDTALFVPLIPLMVNLITNSPGLISYKSQNNLIPGGSTPIYFNFSEPNFDEISITATYTNKEYSQNDDTAKIKELKIPTFSQENNLLKNGKNYLEKNFFTLFQIENAKATNGQVFSFNEINTCYKWKDKIISFNLAETPITIPSNLDQTEIFKFSSAFSDKEIPLNSLKVNFLPPIFPIFLHCVLTCFNLNYPSDNDILNGDMNKNFENFFTKFYFGAFYEKKSYDILFDNLIRGEKYKLKCIISTTESNYLNRKTQVFYMEKMNRIYPEEKSNDLIVKNTYDTQCLQYEFDEAVSNDTKFALVNYCQKFMSQGGYSNNGCFYCVDSSQKFLAVGMEFATNEKIGTCQKGNKGLRYLFDGNDNDHKNDNKNVNDFTFKFPNKKNEKFLQRNSFNLKNKNIRNLQDAISGNNLKAYFSVCQIQNKLCSSDLLNNKTLDSMVDLLSNNTKTSSEIYENLNLKDIKVNNTKIISNTIKPDIKKLTSSINEIKMDGKFSISLEFPSPIRCAWKINLNSTAAPDKDLLLNCQDLTWCGDDKLIYNIKTNLTNYSNLKTFDLKDNYDINFICWNDVPAEKIYSDIQSIVLYRAQTNETAKNSTTGSNSTDPSATDGGSGSGDNTDGKVDGNGSGFSKFSKMNLIFELVLFLLILVY